MDWFTDLFTQHSAIQAVVVLSLISVFGISVICLWILKVDFFVRDVHIACHDDRLGLSQFTEIISERILPSHAVIQSRQLIL